MIAVLSPAKSLDCSPAPVGVPASVPEFGAASEELVRVLCKLSLKKLAALMDVSPKLAALNHERYHAWSTEAADAVRDGRAKQALLAFNGEAYQGIAVDDFTSADFAFAQGHLRILSGLYGVLRPLDLIQPYRLEMGRALKTARARDLYGFWGTRLTETLNTALDHDGSGVLLNLASAEYFASIQPERLRGRVLTCTFKEGKAGSFKFLSFFGKRARGLMADFMIRERLTNPADLKEFSAEGYRFDRASSSDASFVFLRPEKTA